MTVVPKALVISMGYATAVALPAALPDDAARLAATDSVDAAAEELELVDVPQAAGVRASAVAAAASYWWPEMVAMPPAHRLMAGPAGQPSR